MKLPGIHHGTHRSRQFRRGANQYQKGSLQGSTTTTEVDHTSRAPSRSSIIAISHAFSRCCSGSSSSKDEALGLDHTCGLIKAGDRIRLVKDVQTISGPLSTVPAGTEGVVVEIYDDGDLNIISEYPGNEKRGLDRLARLARVGCRLVSSHL